MTDKENSKLKLCATGKIESDENEPLKVVFAPGCFDHINVESQEELDSIMAEIQNMFANMTPEELRAQSRPLTDEDIDALEPEEREAVLRAFADQEDPDTRKNRLQ